MPKLRVLSAGLVFLFASGLLIAQFHRRIAPDEPVTLPPFDHYVLALSWAPDFCAQPDASAANPKECAPGRSIGFVVHGLWPESAEGKISESCGLAKPVSKAVVNMVLRYMFTAARVQREWAEHGVCTGLKPGEYFGNILETRTAVQIPVQITSLEDAVSESPEQIETQFAGANPGFPKTAFRTSCAAGTLQEMRVCFDKALKPRACPVGEAACAMPAIAIHPPR